MNLTPDDLRDCAKHALDSARFLKTAAHCKRVGHMGNAGRAIEDAEFAWHVLGVSMGWYPPDRKGSK